MLLGELDKLEEEKSELSGFREKYHQVNLQLAIANAKVKTTVAADTIFASRSGTSEDFDLDTYAADGQFGWGEGERIRLTFFINKVPGYILLESPLSDDQKVRDVGDQYEISATVVDSGLLRRWLQSFGDEVCDIRTERCSDGLPN